jgi:hypothetical protein
MYVKLREHNGRVILNLGEGGLAVQSAMVLKGDSLALSFKLGPLSGSAELLELSNLHADILTVVQRGDTSV